MPITFSDHARFQIKKRGIRERLVVRAIKNSEKILPSFRGRQLRRIRIGDKILEVVTKIEGSKITVITAYYVEE